MTIAARNKSSKFVHEHRRVPRRRGGGRQARAENLRAAYAGLACAGLESPSQRPGRQAPRPARTTRAIPVTRLPRTPVLLRVFPMVTFSPHLRYNSPRLNDLAIRSNEYLTSKRFLLTTAPIRSMIARVITNKSATTQHP